jgi:hypothetical protein
MRLERVLSADVRLPEGDLPAWLRRTEGEQRLPVSLAVLTAIAFQIVLPGKFALRPHLLLPLLEVALLVGLIAANPVRINRESGVLRTTSLTMMAVISLANAVSAVLLVRNLVNGTAGDSAGALLATGAAIWGTNVIVFALFTQMTAPEVAPPNWEPNFLDYLYLSFTNATAFSPTDVMPLSRWAKMMMLAQSAVSIVAIALVISRAVNVVK